MPGEPVAASARRTLVLLPGMEGSGSVYRPLIEAAPPGVDTLTVTYPPGSTQDYDALLPLVRARLPRDRPYHLLGWSFSGPLALRAAAENPPGLRGVVLASSFVRRPSWVPTALHRLARPWLFRFYPAAAQTKAILGATPRPTCAGCWPKRTRWRAPRRSPPASAPR